MGHDWQVTAVLPLSERHMLNERGCWPASPQEAAFLLGEKINKGKNIGMGSN
jgi:hypothetical protein